MLGINQRSASVIFSFTVTLKSSKKTILSTQSLGALDPLELPILWLQKAGEKDEDPVTVEEDLTGGTVVDDESGLGHMQVETPWFQ